MACELRGRDPLAYRLRAAPHNQPGSSALAMPFFDNPFTPDLGFRRAGCLCRQHESEFEHEKAVALEASRQARRRFIAESFRNLFQRPEGQGDAIGNAVSVTGGRTSKA